MGQTNLVFSKDSFQYLIEMPLNFRVIDRNDAIDN